MQNLSPDICRFKLLLLTFLLHKLQLGKAKKQVFISKSMTKNIFSHRYAPA